MLLICVRPRRAQTDTRRDDGALAAGAQRHHTQTSHKRLTAPELELGLRRQGRDQCLRTWTVLRGRPRPHNDALLRVDIDVGRADETKSRAGVLQCRCDMEFGSDGCES